MPKPRQFKDQHMSLDFVTVPIEYQEIDANDTQSNQNGAKAGNQSELGGGT